MNLLRFSECPIIIIGMHRSGTTMVARLMQKMGIFMGGDNEKNEESKFFLGLNEWILRQSGSRWDNMSGFGSLLENDRYRAILIRYLRFIVKGPRSMCYLRWRVIGPRNIKWGWKDPRNTFTLPLWLEIFPNAQIIYVERDGVDVARSLMIRKDKDTNIVTDHFNYFKWVYSFRLKKESFGGSCLLNSLDDAINLWHQYIIEGRKHVLENREKSLFIHYEKLLENPEIGVSKLAQFLGIEMDSAIVRKIASMVDNSRANVSIEDEHFRDFYKRYRNVLAIHEDGL